jgi:hypothetical protein
MMPGEREVQYLVLPDASSPYLLARVRWPDVCQAISPVRPDWQDDPGLFDLPYDSNSIPVTREQATAIASSWEARMPADEPFGTFEFPMMRRMPADWSNLSRAEQRAWSIDAMDTRPLVTSDDDVAYRSAPPVPSRRRARRRWPWQRTRPALEPLLFPRVQPITDLTRPVDVLPVEPNVSLVLDAAPANVTRGGNGGGWFDGRLPDDDVVIDLTKEVPTPVEER